MANPIQWLQPEQFKEKNPTKDLPSIREEEAFCRVVLFGVVVLVGWTNVHGWCLTPKQSPKTVTPKSDLKTVTP